MSRLTASVPRVFWVLRAAAPLLATAAFAACGGDEDDDGDADGDTPAIDADVAGPDAAGDCPRPAAPADRPRRVVVSHPFDASGGAGTGYEVLSLAEDGALTTTGTSFALARAFSGEIAFTPDGEVGLVAHDDGTLGVFRFPGGDGAPEVVHAAFAGEFMASRVVVDPAGDRAWIVDSRPESAGGGVWGVRIGCDGRLVEAGRHVPAQGAQALFFAPGGRAVLAAQAVLGSLPGQDLHVLSWTPPARVSSLDLFAMSDPLVGGAALVTTTAGGRFVLVGNVSPAGPLKNRVLVARLADDGTLAGSDANLAIEDPFAIAADPRGEQALVVSGFGNALHVLAYDPVQPLPWLDLGAIDYSGAPPDLPGQAVAVARGALTGLVLVAESQGVRRVQLGAAGAATDLGVTSLGAGTAAIVGALGVQP